MIKIIAEAGINWNSFNEAVEYAEKAKEIGADIIKYQWIKDESLPDKQCHMNKGEWKALKGYCDKIGIELMCTPSSKDIANYLYWDLDCNLIKIGSDHVRDLWVSQLLNELSEDIFLLSDGYYDSNYYNMYCISLYSCDPKFIDFKKMAEKKYIGFSDHTLRYDKEWIKQIPDNIQYYEKHFKLKDDVLDDVVSLDVDQFKKLIKNIREVKG